MHKQHLYYLLLLLMILSFVVFTMKGLTQPLILDEVDFFNAAKGIVHTGRPIFYQGESYPDKVGLWHPPTFLYFIATIMNLTTYPELTTKIILLLFSIATIFLCLSFASKFAHQSHLLKFFLVFLFITNAYFVRSSTLIDYVSSFLSFFVALFLLLYLSFLEKSSLRLFLLLEATTFILISTNFSIAPYLIFSTTLFSLLSSHSIKKTIINALIIFFPAGLLFLILWWGYSISHQFSFFTLFTHSLSFVEGTNQHQLVTILSTLRSLLLWFTPSGIILAGIGMYCWRKDKKVRLFILFFLGILLQYLFTQGAAYTFPKYEIPFLPFFIIIIAIVSFSTLEKSSHYLPALLTTLLILMYLLLVSQHFGDPLILLFLPAAKLLSMPVHVFNITILFYIVPLLLSLIINYTLLNARAKPLFILTLFSVFVATNLFMIITQSSATYSVIYAYGEDYTLALHASHLAIINQSTIIAPKDFAYYLNQRYYEVFDNYPRILQLARQNNISTIIIRKNQLSAVSSASFPNYLCKRKKFYESEYFIMYQ